MFESKFFINGKRATKEAAKEHWLDSETYSNANRNTRHHIWTIATNGDETGNHNPWGEVDHLNEAGITIES